MTGPKDRWHQLDDAIDAWGLPASDRSVFRCLLKRADWKTAELPPKFTPDRPTIGRVTGLSLRQVHYSVRHLQRHGWLTVGGATGRGHTRAYVLTIGTGCDCTGRVHLPPKKGATPGQNGATTAPFKVQPKGATPQVRPEIALRGTEREGEGKRERKPESPPEPASVRVLGDGSGPDDRDSFDGWLALISRRAEPSRGTPPGRQP